MTQKSIRSQLIGETPFTIIDFETTGLRPGADRVVEVSVVRLDPGRRRPQLVFDTLVNPGRPMAATDIHGIRDEDVADAPRFEEVAADLAAVIAGTIVTSYNVYFDMPFLRYELANTGRAAELPHLCVMYLRPMLGLGTRCGLDDACAFHNVPRSASHMASADAVAAAEVLVHCLKAAEQRQLRTFGDLARLKDYRFLSSFDLPPLAVQETTRSAARRKSRIPLATAVPSAEGTSTKRRLAVYWESLVAVLSDLAVTDEEVAVLARKQSECDLDAGQVRALHARAFAQVLTQFGEDKSIDETECDKLQRLHACLGHLGWAPGQASGFMNRSATRP